MRRRIVRRGLVLAVAAAALATAPAANAGPLVASVKSCPVNTFEQPFVRWLDPLPYTLVPDGTLERGGNGWGLSGAKVASGNETFYVHAAGESKSLSLPPGSTATTPVMCAGIDKPVLRFFAKSSASLLSSLAVDVIFETASGQVVSLPVGVVLPTSQWQPTLPLVVNAALLPLLPGSQTPVQFRFRPVGGATWSMDDVYLDPRHK